MKKYTITALLLALALTLSACGNNEAQNDDGSGTPSNSNSENNSGDKSDDDSGDKSDDPAGDNSAENTGDPDFAEGQAMSVQQVIDTFPKDSFIAPDGTEIMLTEATSQMLDYMLLFDFAYIRYGEPIYSDTVANPELYDFTEFEFTVDENAEVDAKPFQVVKGQVLDNGMTVSNASLTLSPEGVRENIVDLDGEITLEGILFCFFEDEYGFDQDEMIFYPNPKSATVPLIYDYFSRTLSGVDLFSEFAFVCDGDIIRLGNVNEEGNMDWFKDSSYIRVKVTLKDLKLSYNDMFGAKCFGTLKSMEFLDS